MKQYSYLVFNIYARYSLYKVAFYAFAISLIYYHNKHKHVLLVGQEQECSLRLQLRVSLGFKSWVHGK